jgi:hypothetical protein
MRFPVSLVPAFALTAVLPGLLELSRPAALLLGGTMVDGQATVSPPRGWTATGETPEAAELIRTCDEAHRGRCSARLTAGPGNGTIVLAQVVSAARFAGARLVLAGWVKTEAAARAQLWLRVDAGRTIVALDNMGDRPVSASTPWTEYRLALDVPTGADDVAFGLVLRGGGRAWVDDLSLTTAEPETVASTDVLPSHRVWRHEAGRAPSLRTRLPENLDVEQ